MKGKTSKKRTNGQKIYVSENKIDLKGSCALGIYNMYMSIIDKQVYWYISQMSDERLQNHWSSGVFKDFDQN